MLAPSPLAESPGLSSLETPRQPWVACAPPKCFVSRSSWFRVRSPSVSSVSKWLSLAVSLTERPFISCSFSVSVIKVLSISNIKIYKSDRAHEHVLFISLLLIRFDENYAVSLFGAYAIHLQAEAF